MIIGGGLNLNILNSAAEKQNNNPAYCQVQNIKV
jgi:hypothetical protein